jgi:hypothetical protein
MRVADVLAILISHYAEGLSDLGLLAVTASVICVVTVAKQALVFRHETAQDSAAKPIEQHTSCASHEHLYADQSPAFKVFSKRMAEAEGPTANTCQHPSSKQTILI